MYQIESKRMKKGMRKGFALFVALVMAVAVWTAAPLPANAETDGDFTYEVSGGNTATITGYTGSEPTVSIPATVGGSYTVTAIGDYAFQGGVLLTSVTIPSGVTSIGDYTFDSCYLITNISIPSSVTSIGKCAFLECHNLPSIAIPNNVVSIGDWAFLLCDSLIQIDIPSSVTIIGYGAFWGCNSLTAINVDAGNSSYSSDNGVLFDQSKGSLIECPVGKTGVYTIPDDVNYIGEYAFEYCSSLTSVTIPDSVTNLGRV